MVLPGGDDPMIAAAAATAARAAQEPRSSPPPEEPAADSPEALARPAAGSTSEDRVAGSSGPADAGFEPAGHVDTDDGDDGNDLDDQPDLAARVEELARYATELLEVVDGADERFSDDYEAQARAVHADHAKAMAAADELEAHLLERVGQARRIAEQKARGPELESLLSQPLAESATPVPSSPTALIDALDQELKLAKGILGAQRMGDLAALLVRGSQVVHRMRDQADAEQQRRLEAAARVRDDAETNQQNRLSRGLALVHHDLRAFLSELPPSTAEWDDPRWESWQPPDRAYRWLRYGMLHRPDLGEVSVPAVLAMPGDRGVRLEGGAHHDEAVGAVQAMVVRLLAALPPGQARFTFLDATGLGETMVPFLALARYRPELVDGGVHTTPEAIDRALAELTRQVETVTHQHLRGRYANLVEANRDTDDPVPHRFLVVVDHPNGLSETALKQIKVIAETGPRAGVHPIVISAAGPGAWGAKLDGLHLIRADRDGFYLDVDRAGRWRLDLDGPPSLELAAQEGAAGVFTRIVTGVGEAAQRVQNPPLAPAAVVAGWSEEALLRLRADRPDLRQALDPDDSATWWTAPADRGVGGPLGLDGTGAAVGTWLDSDRSEGLLIVGDDRTVVSEAVAAAVHGLVLAHGPDELALWLVGLRGRRTLRPEADGRLVHARLVAIDVEARVALAALDAADTELDRRRLMLTALGVSDEDALGGYREATGRGLERMVVVIDGIEQLVAGQGEVARRAAERLERLTAEGAAVGIHIVAGLGGGRLDARQSRWLSTMLPTTVEVGVPLEGADTPAPEPSVVRPLRTAAAARRRRLRELRRRADAAGDRRRPRIMRGDEPAALEPDHLSPMASGGVHRRDRRMPRLLLGEAASLVGPCEITLQRRPGQHVVIAGGGQVARAGIEMAAGLSVLACHGRDVEVRVVDLTAPDVGFGEAALALSADFPVTVARTNSIAGLVRDTRRDAERRQATRSFTDAPIVLVVHDADRLDEAVVADLAVVARIGAEVGVHLVAGIGEVATEVVATLAALANHRLVLGGLPSATVALAVALDAGESTASVTPPWAMAIDQERAQAEPFRPFGLPSSEGVLALASATRDQAPDAADRATVSLAG